MNCKQTESLMGAYIEQGLDSIQAESFTKHVQSCTSCKESLKEHVFILNQVAKLPVELPNPSLKMNFEKMLKRELEYQEQKDVGKIRILRWERWKIPVQIAATLLLMLCTYWMGNEQGMERAEKEFVSEYTEPLQDVDRETLAMMDSESASQRLKAMHQILDTEAPGNDILHALIRKLFFDSHINVRLAAAEALGQFADQKDSRKALLKAFDQEKDPTMQIELMRILVQIQEKGAVATMERLLFSQETPPYVKEQMKRNLPSIKTPS